MPKNENPDRRIVSRIGSTTEIGRRAGPARLVGMPREARRRRGTGLNTPAVSFLAKPPAERRKAAKSPRSPCCHRKSRRYRNPRYEQLAKVTWSYKRCASASSARYEDLARPKKIIKSQRREAPHVSPSSRRKIAKQPSHADKQHQSCSRRDRSPARRAQASRLECPIPCGPACGSRSGRRLA
jgi:hypothetical protein